MKSRRIAGLYNINDLSIGNIAAHGCASPWQSIGLVSRTREIAHRTPASVLSHVERSSVAGFANEDFIVRHTSLGNYGWISTDLSGES